MMSIYLPPDLMKVDVERAEYETLLGATMILKEARPFIIIESWRTEASQQALEYLQGHDCGSSNRACSERG